MKPLLITLIILSLITTSCQSDYNIEYLIGDWKVSKWEIERTGETRNNRMDMNFKNDKTYEINYGGTLEKGRFWLADEFLHTVENKKSEKKVRILKLNSDTLEFQMNRAGELENVLLVKQ